jgi:hypothetical protein
MYVNFRVYFIGISGNPFQKRCPRIGGIYHHLNVSYFLAAGVSAFASGAALASPAGVALAEVASSCFS